MSNLIARVFGLHTEREMRESCERVATERRAYYEKVIDYLHKNGSLPPNCDLKLPKARLRITNAQTGEVRAENGQWKELPMDNEIVQITYAKDV